MINKTTMMEQIYYGEDRTIQIMQSENKGWLFYVSHNTPELFDDYIQYCTDNQLDPTEEDTATSFVDYRDQLFEESLQHDMATID